MNMNWKWSRRVAIAFCTVPLLTAVAPAARAQEEKKVPERSEIDKKYLWATELIYPTMDAWEKDYAKVDGQLKEFAKLTGTLTGGDALLKALKLHDDIGMALEKVAVFASLLAAQDTRDNGPQGMESRVRGLIVNYGQATSWFEPELTALAQDKLEAWMNGNKDLALYRHYFDNLFRQKKHILSSREEELIALGGQMFAVPSTAYELLTNADIKFPTITDAKGGKAELSDAAFYMFMDSPDRRVRKDAYEGIVGTYRNYRNTAAALLNGAVQGHLFSVRARNYESCLAAALDGGNIPVAVYDNLIKTVNDNLPLLHRYTTLRKKVLKLADGVHDYDLYVPLTAEAELKYTYEEAVQLVKDALKPLGDEYVKVLGEGIDSRWIDVYTTKGKSSGAFSSGTYTTQPFILLNYFGRYEDASTMAHELGHSMHSYLSHHNQPYVYGDYDIFCAEVASITNELLLQQYVIDRVTDPKVKLYLLSALLESFRGTVFRQTLFSEFERQIHTLAEQGQPLTADALGQVYGGIMKKYYGPDYAHDELVDNYWIRIPHFYRNFYVYKYATSYCAAANIANRVRENEPGAVDAYLTFLKGGSSKYPLELLKGARVDMASPAPIQDAMKLFEKILDQTEELLAQQK